MVAVDLTPRVRIMAVCNGVRRSKMEWGVFDLKGVRQSFLASTFPFVARLWLYLLLSSPRAGDHAGYVVLVNEKTDKTVFYSHLMPRPSFEQNAEFLPVCVRMRCSIPEPGRYTVQVYFFRAQGRDVVKGELPIDVFQEGA
jgi:hypothetical protein